MKKVVIDKQIILDHEFEKINELSCFERIETTAIQEGLECNGIIEIKGSGVVQGNQIPIAETIDLSIFAPFDRISPSEQFSVTLSDSKFHLDHQLLMCSFTFDVSGLVDEDEKMALKQDEGSIEDLLDDSQVVNEIVRYVLVNPDDSYASLAARYHVSESEIRKLNQNKTFLDRTLILLPLC